MLPVFAESLVGEFHSMFFTFSRSFAMLITCSEKPLFESAYVGAGLTATAKIKDTAVKVPEDLQRCEIR